MKLLLQSLFVVLLLSCFQQNLFSAKENQRKAEKHFSEIEKLLKESRKKNSDRIISELQKIIDLFEGQSSLDSESEFYLERATSVKYWVEKFTKFDSVLVYREKGKKNKPEKQEDIGDEWLTWRKLKVKNYEEAEKEIRKEEKSGKNESQNFINYLNLHDKVINAEQADGVLKKIKEYYERKKNDQEATLDEMLKDLGDYRTLMNEKDYEQLARRMAALLRYSHISDKYKFVIKNFVFEMKAMHIMKESLIDNNVKTLPFPEGVVKGFSGFLDKANQRGINVVSNDLKSRLYYPWDEVDEKWIFTMAEPLYKGSDSDKSLFILAVINLRMGNYHQSFEGFRKLINKDAARILKYSDFLTRCEIGYRVKQSENLDFVIDKANSLISRGRSNEAVFILNLLFNELQEQSLGSTFINRLLSATKSLKGSGSIE